ncbi:hypothetical protein BDR26DRAFT_1006195 [Obelidium mucronatum]|nr:hypothetical protein BDR26DRAFT_1006195 [Obelidium mucronatum]
MTKDPNQKENLIGKIVLKLSTQDPEWLEVFFNSLSISGSQPSTSSQEPRLQPQEQVDTRVGATAADEAEDREAAEELRRARAAAIGQAAIPVVRDVDDPLTDSDDECVSRHNVRSWDNGHYGYSREFNSRFYKTRAGRVFDTLTDSAPYYCFQCQRLGRPADHWSNIHK